MGLRACSLFECNACMEILRFAYYSVIVVLVPTWCILVQEKQLDWAMSPRFCGEPLICTIAFPWPSSPPRTRTVELAFGAANDIAAEMVTFLVTS